MQEEITQDEIIEAHQKLSEFSDGFETLYVQRQADHIHFVRPCIHTLSHFAPETTRIGPAVLHSQWTMERTIGNLGEEIKQYSNPFANLAQRGLCCCQVNSLKAMIPDLEPPENPIPRGGRILGMVMFYSGQWTLPPMKYEKLRQTLFIDIKDIWKIMAQFHISLGGHA